MRETLNENETGDLDNMFKGLSFKEQEKMIIDEHANIENQHKTEYNWFDSSKN